MLKKLRQFKILLILFLSVTGLILIVSGLFLQYGTDQEIMTSSELINSVYHHVFGEEYLVLRDHPIEEHWSIWLGTLTMKIVIILFGITAFDHLFHEQLLLFRFQFISGLKKLFRFGDGHVLIVGAGSRGLALAHNYMNLRQVVVVELNPENENIAVLRNEGALVLVGDGIEIKNLKRIRPTRASKIYLVTKNDSTNIKIAQNLGELTSCPVFCAVESPELKMFFQDNQKSIAPKSTITGFRYRAALNVSKDVGKELGVLPEIKQNGIKAILYASEELRIDMLRALVVMLQVSGNKVPEICICGSTDSDKERFDHYFPAADIAFKAHWDQNMPNTAMKKLNWKETDVHLVMVALDEDADTLSCSDRISLDHPAAIVIACLRDENDLIDLAEEKESQHDSARKLHIESLYGIVHSKVRWHSDDVEAEAKELHEKYRRNSLNSIKKECQENGEPYDEAKILAGKPQLHSWEELSSGLKESNRLATHHGEIKRYINTHHAFDMTEKESLEYFARMEKFRWNAEKAMAGWKYGTPREDKLKLHDKLIPWEQLAEEEKEKDREVVRKNLRSVRSAAI